MSSNKEFYEPCWQVTEKKTQLRRSQEEVHQKLAKYKEALQTIADMSDYAVPPHEFGAVAKAALDE